MGELLGEGQFGRVMAASALNIGGLQGCVKVATRRHSGDFMIVIADIKVAVKMLRPGSSSPSDLSDLITEYNLMRDLDHPNVIKLLGACTDSRYNIYFILIIL